MTLDIKLKKIVEGLAASTRAYKKAVAAFNAGAKACGCGYDSPYQYDSGSGLDHCLGCWLLAKAVWEERAWYGYICRMLEEAVPDYEDRKYMKMEIEEERRAGRAIRYA